MNFKLTALLFVFAISTPLSSWALFEARLTGGVTQAKPDLKDICTGSCSNPSGLGDITSVPGVGLDAIVKLPLIPFGFGLRYEGLKMTADQGSYNTEIK